MRAVLTQLDGSQKEHQVKAPYSTMIVPTLPLSSVGNVDWLNPKADTTYYFRVSRYKLVDVLNDAEDGPLTALYQQEE